MKNKTEAISVQRLRVIIERLIAYHGCPTLIMQDELPWSKRTKKALDDIGVCGLGYFTERKISDLLKYRAVTRSVLREIEECLAVLGLSLKGERD